jgi:hypothetical protein
MPTGKVCCPERSRHVDLRHASVDLHGLEVSSGRQVQRGLSIVVLCVCVHRRLDLIVDRCSIVPSIPRLSTRSRTITISSALKSQKPPFELAVSQVSFVTLFPHALLSPCLLISTSSRANTHSLSHRSLYLQYLSSETRSLFVLSLSYYSLRSLPPFYFYFYHASFCEFPM